MGNRGTSTSNNMLRTKNIHQGFSTMTTVGSGDSDERQQQRHKEKESEGDESEQGHE